MNWRTLRLTASTTVLLAAIAGAPAFGLEVSVLSSQPQLVTGGDALIEVTDATAAPSVTLNGTDVSASISWTSSAGAPSVFRGLVTGLKDGDNELSVSAGGQQAALTLTNHPLQETLFAGPQDTPFLCELEAFMLTPAADAKFDPLDADCAAETQVKYYYRSTADNMWKPFDENGARPTDIANGTNAEGMTFPLIVRQEMGVINRAAYVINIPHDPAAGPLADPSNKGGTAWNGKLIYSFGPGARGDGHHMGRGLGGLQANRQFMEEGGTADWFIARGYAIAAGSLNAFGTSTDDIVSAETANKVKEHFIEQFGPPEFTVGIGGSGGSMQQFLISNNYPGLLDGIIPSAQYADTMTFLQPLFDCELLVNVFNQGTWTREQMDAVSGKYWGFCVSNGTRYPTRRAQNCDTAVLAMIEATPSIKAQDVRCTYQDDLKQVYGTDPETGKARSPWDNVGVQYGLAALNDGAITFEQFLDINRRIGGHDIDGNLVPERTVGDPEAVAAAYKSGRINLLANGNRNVPIIMQRSWIDGDPFMRGDANVDVHDGYHSYIVLARAEKYNGNRDNVVNLFSARGAMGGAAEGTPQRLMGVEAAAMMEQWLININSDTSDRPLAEKVAANKPEGFTDTCWAANDMPTYADPTTVGEVTKHTNWARCEEIFPTTTEARMVAGGPLTADIIKCDLKPVDAADYSVAPSAEQLAALREIFPEGVCDWTKPGVGFTTDPMAWAFYEGNGAFRPVS